MIQQKTQLTTKINDKEHIYQCDPNSSLSDVYESLNVFRNYIFGRIKEQEELQKTSETSEVQEKG